MLSPKLLIISAIIGFVLAFVAGIAGGVYFGVVILRSLLSAIFCGALSFGVAFLARSFLSIPEDVFASEPQAAGSTVDIVLDDEELAEDGAAGEMMFPETRRDSSATAKKSPVSGVSEQAASGSVQSASSVSGAARPAAADAAEDIGELQTVDDADVSAVEDIETLSDLPDIDSVSIGGKKSAAVAQQPDEDLIPDQVVSGGTSKEVLEMAKAIRTVLVKDDS